MTDSARPTIIRLTADQLRKIADQLDAYTALEAAGANHPAGNTVITVDDLKVAYLHWWHSDGQFMAEFINFVPGDAEPLYYLEDLSVAPAKVRSCSPPGMAVMVDGKRVPIMPLISGPQYHQRIDV